MALVFKLFNSSNGSNGSWVLMAQGFKCFKDVNGSRFQMVQGFKWFMGLNGLRVQRVQVFKGQRWEKYPNLRSRFAENIWKLLAKNHG